MKLFKTFTLFLLLVLTSVYGVNRVKALENTVQEFQGEIVGYETTETGQVLDIRFLEGPETGTNITVEQDNSFQTNARTFKKGDRVLVVVNTSAEGEVFYSVGDYVRTEALAIVFVAFLALALFIARKKALASFLSLGFTFLIIFMVLLPALSSGQDPVWATIGSAILIIPVTYYLAHGVSRKTNVAILGTLIALVITGVISALATDAARLSGFINDETHFLKSLNEMFDLKGILLAGMILALLGVLDDVTISQSAIVAELKETDAKLQPAELYEKAMKIGTDHIASVINTLFLVYAGASIPLLLLFQFSGVSAMNLLNYETIATEIIRTLTGSIGLMLAVPITTLLAAFLSAPAKRQ